MLDYDKKFLIKSWDNLTFDGSSIRVLQLSGKAICGLRWIGALFTGVPLITSAPQSYGIWRGHRQGWHSYSADIRGALKGFAEQLHKKEGYTLNAAMKLKGFSSKPSAELTIMRRKI